MASPAASAETDPTKVTVDPQDPTPDPSWEFRRWFVYIGRAIISGLLLISILTLANLGEFNPSGAINALTYIAIGLLVWGIMDSAIYQIGPSAEQFGLWAKTVGAMVQGVVFRKRGEAETADGKVSSESVSGKPAASPEPEAEPAEQSVPDQPSWKS